MSGGTRRLDQWLWFARFFKSRTLATRFCALGKLRVNTVTVAKAHYALKIGDVLTFPLGPHVRVIAVRDLGTRRGPPVEARTLYADLEPPMPSAEDFLPPVAERPSGTGRPTKAERRAIDRLRGRDRP
jgi:ribosome-associated heat shock protein Hsp15